MASDPMGWWTLNLDKIRDEPEERWAEGLTEDRAGIEVSEASAADWLAGLRPELRIGALDAMRSWLGGSDEWREIAAVRIASRFRYRPVLSDALRLATAQGAARDARNRRLLVEIVDRYWATRA